MSSLLPARISGAVYPVFRVVVGFLFACHGASTLFGVLGGADGSGGVVPFGVWPAWWSGAIEFVGGTLVAVGLGTRVAAFICSGSMAYAYFTVHQGLGALPIQNGGEPAALYSWLFLLIAALGPGSIAVDNLWRRSHPSAAELSPATSG